MLVILPAYITTIKTGLYVYYQRMFDYTRQASRHYPLLAGLQDLLGALYESHDSCSRQRSADAATD